MSQLIPRPEDPTTSHPSKSDVPFEVPPGMLLEDAMKLSTKVIENGILIEDITDTHTGFCMMPESVPSQTPGDKPYNRAKAE